MPTLAFRLERLRELTGLGVEDLIETLFRLKCEAEVEGDRIYIEVNADRPDMFLGEGVARAVKGLLGVETGLPSYEHVESGFELLVEDVPSRPFIAAAVVYDVDVDEVFLEELIQFQEKLHETLGRRRRKVAIGLHDVDKVPSRRLVYREVDVEKARMVPLGYDSEMSVAEVLSTTEQGRVYGGIALRDGRHPAFMTEDGVILSLPPVINSELTRVEPGTRNLLVDVTGTDKTAVMQVLNVLVYTLVERSRSRRVGVVRLRGVYSGETPVWSVKTLRVEHSRIEGWLGARLSRDEVVDALERMRHGVEAEGGVYTVSVAPFRVDILSWVDIVEDVAIAVGYERVGWEAPPPRTRGSLSPERRLERGIRRVLAGLGYTEVFTFTLSSCELQERLSGAPPAAIVRIANPVSRELACLRASIIPHLLEVLAANKHITPLRVFELGEVAVVDADEPEGVRVEKRVAMLLSDRKAGYEDIQAHVWSLIEALGDEVVEVRRCSHPALIEGRTACIKTRLGMEGVIGEVKPEVLVDLGVYNPAAVAEIRYDTVEGFKPRLVKPS